MNLIFLNQQTKVMTLVLDNDKRCLQSFEVELGKEKMARLYFPKIATGNPTYTDLEMLIKYCLDDNTDLKLKDHLYAIHSGRVKFRSPHKRSLRLEVTI